MSTKLETVECADFETDTGQGILIDPLTNYKCHIWEQTTFTPGRRVFMVLYLRHDKWRRASAQMTDRMLRRAGLPQLSKAPWGPGPEMGLAVDDILDANAQKLNASSAANVSRET